MTTIPTHIHHHDPHRVDAVISCLADALAERQDPRDDVALLALSLAVDHRALLLLRPLTGPDETVGRSIIDRLLLADARTPPTSHRIVDGRTSIIICAVATRLASTAIALAPHGSTDLRDAARWLWSTAGQLAALSQTASPPTDDIADGEIGHLIARTSEMRAALATSARQRRSLAVRLRTLASAHLLSSPCPSDDVDEQVAWYETALPATMQVLRGSSDPEQKTPQGTPADAIEALFGAVGIPCEVRVNASGGLRPICGRPSAEQMTALRKAAKENTVLTAEMVPHTHGTRCLLVRAADNGCILSLAWSVLGDEGTEASS